MRLSQESLRIMADNGDVKAQQILEQWKHRLHSDPLAKVDCHLSSDNLRLDITPGSMMRPTVPNHPAMGGNRTVSESRRITQRMGVVKQAPPAPRETGGAYSIINGR